MKTCLKIAIVAALAAAAALRLLAHDCRSRADNAAENLATFRHLLVGVLH